MANTQVNLTREPIGGAGPWQFDLGVDGGTHIYEGILVSQLTATGMLVPYSTSSSGVVVGVSQHEVDNSTGSDGDRRCVVETGRVYAFTNGTSTDAFSEASLIGAVVYGVDDHTVADNSAIATRKAVGFFMGMESDGRVRVLILPWLAGLVNALQGLADNPASVDALRDNIVAAFG
jgi:hypothetical protein